jgi:hypothetical protein
MKPATGIIAVSMDGGRAARRNGVGPQNAREARGGFRASGYSTVTDLARLRGWSTSVPLRMATWYASSCKGTVYTIGAWK